MNSFVEVFADLMDERGIDTKTLAEELGFDNSSILYRWKQGKLGLSLASAVKIADFFECSLEYLFGRIEEYERYEHKGYKPFDTQFRKILKEQNLSQNRLLKDRIISGGSIDNWLGKKRTPTMETLKKLAAYLNVSLDYLVGREP